MSNKAGTTLESSSSGRLNLGKAWVALRLPQQLGVLPIPDMQHVVVRSHEV